MPTTDSLPHTPGEWRIDEDDATTYRILGPGEKGQFDNEICELSYTGGNAEANAHLIEAAPDLLAALKFCRSVISDNGAWEMSWRIALEKADAAIAKARGQAVTA